MVEKEIVVSCYVVGASLMRLFSFSQAKEL